MGEGVNGDVSFPETLLSLAASAPLSFSLSPLRVKRKEKTKTRKDDAYENERRFSLFYKEESLTPPKKEQKSL